MCQNGERARISFGGSLTFCRNQPFIRASIPTGVAFSALARKKPANWFDEEIGDLEDIWAEHFECVSLVFWFFS